MGKSAKPEIRAVFFDIGNVLLDYDVSGVIRSLAWSVRSHPVRIVRMLWDRRIVDDVERGRIRPRDLFRTFRRELGFPNDYRRFRRLWCGGLSFVPRTAAMLKSVSRRRPVYLLSNTNRLHFDYIRRRYAFARQVKGAVLSYRVGKRKPEPGIYRAALRKARVPARKTLFIDDLPENVEAARKLGWNALRYRGPARLERELRGLGLLDGR